MGRLTLSLVLALCAAVPALAQVSGRAAVIDADSITINDRDFDLYGIDAVEFHQFCFVNGRSLACGPNATRFLQTLLDPVITTCEPVGEGNYATCSIDEGDVAELIARAGWALAVPEQTEAYVEAVDAARDEGAGIWQGAFLEPSIYDADMAAIAERFQERASTEIAVAVAARLAEPTILILEGFTVSEGTPGTASTISVAGIGPSFVQDSIPPRTPFAWDIPAAALANWQAASERRALTALDQAIWAELMALPAETVSGLSPEAYYAAVTSGAAPLIEAGRQPVLLVNHAANPEWLVAWFGEEGLADATIEVDPENETPGYVGRIDGIDIYVGDVPGGRSFLFPSDILSEIVIDSDADAITTEVVAGEEPVVRFTYGRDLIFDDGPLLWITHPDNQPDNPYN